jgi:polyphosphate kinase
MTTTDEATVRAPEQVRIPPTVRPRPVPPDAPLDHPSLYFNRELGWLDFNLRVFEQARDPRTPLLERVRFLAITCSNLDEFVQKRIGGLRRQEAAGVGAPSPDGRIPSEQLALVRQAVQIQQSLTTRLWEDELKPLLRSEAGLRISHYDELSLAEHEALHDHFREQIYPVLTPLAVDPGHPFPFISNLSLSLAVELRDPDRGDFHFARVKVPTQQGRWVPVPGSGLHFVPLEELVRHHVSSLFRGMTVVGCHLFRVTRNADVMRDEEEAEDLIAMISEELRERRTAPVVRLEVEGAMPPRVRELLVRELELGQDDVTPVDGDLALAECLELADLPLPHLLFPPWEPCVPPRLWPVEEEEGRRDIFSIIREGDVLVHHPYDSFTHTVQRLVEEAAMDPNVLAIKQTLYRTSDDSPIIRALMRAAERGKQVAVLVEVKARFDEQNNIEWARILENHGVHITYGLVGLKTHAKVVLIIRKEEGRPRAYCHIGTGNYHVDNARIYTDLGLLTCDPEIGADAVDLFHALTGHAPAQGYRKLLVAPMHLRDHFIRLIRREVDHQESGSEGRIVAKMNAIDDPKLIRELYRASRKGVSIDLLVRGHSRLRPGLPGFSENIRITSIIGRFLEHDRIFLFGNGGDPEIFLGSADWRVRNLDERVEVMAPVEEPSLKARIIRLLEAALEDNRLAFDLQSDGSYLRRFPAEDEEERDLHLRLMEGARAGA